MTARGIHTCCPEAPSTINVTQNIIELDGDTAAFKDEYFTGDGVETEFTLSITPYDPNSVLVSLNSGVQRRNVDWVLVNNVVRFTFAPASGAVIHVHFFAVSGVSTLTSDSIETGTILGYPGSTVPTGYLFMDGTTSHAKATYAELWAFLTSNPTLVLSSTATHFVLKNITTSYYDVAAGAPVTSTSIIKT